MMRAVVLAIAALALFAGGAAAQTRAEVRACFPDAVKHCGVTADAGAPGTIERLRIKGCMLLHRARGDLSTPCKRVFQAHGF